MSVCIIAVQSDRSARERDTALGSLVRMKMGDGDITDGNPQHYLGFSASMYFLYPGSSGQP